MKDQAASLRQLKKLVDQNRESPELTHEELLKSMEKPCRFSSVLLIYLDQVGKPIPVLQQWFPQFLIPEKRACLWDQAGLLAAGTVLVDLEKGALPDLQHVETVSGPIATIPIVRWLRNIHSGDAVSKSRFVKHLDRLIGLSSELWVTLPGSQLGGTPYLVHAVDAACILVPNHPEAIVRAYETIKTLHLSGFFAPIGLIIEPQVAGESVQPIFDRINSVSQKFLSLDLHLAGVITSGNMPRNPPENGIRRIIDSVLPSARDFLYAFAERLFYPLPGDLPEDHD